MDKEARKKEIADLIYAIVLELMSRGRHEGAWGANVGAELGKRAGLDAVQTAGYRRLTDFIRSCCPNLTVTAKDGGAVLITPLAQPKPIPILTPETLAHSAPSESSSPIDVSTQSIDWLAMRYAPFAAALLEGQIPNTRAGFDALIVGDESPVIHTGEINGRKWSPGFLPVIMKP